MARWNKQVRHQEKTDQTPPYGVEEDLEEIEDTAEGTWDDLNGTEDWTIEP